MMPVPEVPPDYFSEPEFQAEHTQPQLADSPPYSREAEEAVIGCVLISPAIYNELRDMLERKDFYIHRLGFIWEAFERLFETQMGIDMLTVSQELDDMGRLDDVGGSAYLTALLNQVPTTLHADSYAKTVKEHAANRDILNICNVAATEVYAGRKAQDTITAMTEHLTTIALDTGNAWHGLVSSHDAVLAADRLAEQRSDPHRKRLITGLKDLDDLLKRLGESNLYIVAGRPGNGKTSFLLTVMLNACLAGFRVLFFSLEMSKEQLIYRLLSALIWIKFNVVIDNERIGEGALKDDEWQYYNSAVETLQGLPFRIDDTPALTPAQVRTRARFASQREGVDLVLLDYIQLMTPNGSKKNQSREQEVSSLSRSTKNLARELNVPLMAACQMSRAIEQRSDGEPQLSDLRDSGSLEQDADVVMFLHPAKDDVGLGIKCCKVAKHRNGRVGSSFLFFRGQSCRFENAISRSVSEKP